MKYYWIFVLVFILIIPIFGEKKDKKKQDNSYNTPKEYIPFKKFRKPYKRFYTDPLKFTGYGREKKEPENLKSVKIGFLGPIKALASVATGLSSYELVLGKKMLQGAQLAIDQANKRGGYLKRKIPYELIVRNDNGLWGASGNEIIHFAYKEKVWAILGTIDGANSHIAIRVALKAELPMMNTGDTDPTFSETGIQWAFRNITDDRQMCYLLADYIFKKLKLKRVAALRSNSRYGRIGIDEFRDGARRLGFPFVIELNYNNGDTDFIDKLKKINAMDPDVVITYGNLPESALILKQMRALNMDQWFVGSDRMVSREFFKIAGKNIGKVLAGFPYNPKEKNNAFLRFRENYIKRYGEEPETYASHAFDGVNMLLEAINRGGLNRYRIRDEMAKMKRFKGVTGTKIFDNFYTNISPPSIAIVKKGKWDFYTYREIFKKRSILNIE